MGNRTRAVEFVDFLSSGYGAVVEGKNGRFLTPTFNYEIKLYRASGWIHEMEVVRRLLSGEIKLSQTPKKLYPVMCYKGKIKIADNPFSWKGVATKHQK